MALIDEINEKCTPEQIALRDYDAIAATVSAGRTRIATKLGGIGTVLETLGPDDGAALLDTLETIAAGNSAVKWAFVLINRGELDFGSSATRGMMDLLLPAEVAAALKSVAEVPDRVTAQQVSDAMGKI